MCSTIFLNKYTTIFSFKQTHFCSVVHYACNLSYTHFNSSHHNSRTHTHWLHSSRTSQKSLHPKKPLFFFYRYIYHSFFVIFFGNVYFFLLSHQFAHYSNFTDNKRLNGKNLTSKIQYCTNSEARIKHWCKSHTSTDDACSDTRHGQYRQMRTWKHKNIFV